MISPVLEESQPILTRYKRDRRLNFPSFSGILLHEGVTAQPHTFLTFAVYIMHRKQLNFFIKIGIIQKLKKITNFFIEMCEKIEYFIENLY